MTLEEELRVYDLIEQDKNSSPETKQEYKQQIADKYCAGCLGVFHLHYKEYRIDHARGYN